MDYFFIWIGKKPGVKTVENILHKTFALSNHVHGASDRFFLYTTTELKDPIEGIIKELNFFTPGINGRGLKVKNIDDLFDLSYQDPDFPDATKRSAIRISQAKMDEGRAIVEHELRPPLMGVAFGADIVKTALMMRRKGIFLDVGLDLFSRHSIVEHSKDMQPPSLLFPSPKSSSEDRQPSPPPISSPLFHPHTPPPSPPFSPSPPEEKGKPFREKRQWTMEEIRKEMPKIKNFNFGLQCILDTKKLEGVEVGFVWHNDPKLKGDESSDIQMKYSGATPGAAAFYGDNLEECTLRGMSIHAHEKGKTFFLLGDTPKEKEIGDTKEKEIGEKYASYNLKNGVKYERYRNSLKDTEQNPNSNSWTWHCFREPVRANGFDKGPSDNKPASLAYFETTPVDAVVVNKKIEKVLDEKGNVSEKVSYEEKKYPTERYDVIGPDAMVVKIKQFQDPRHIDYRQQKNSSADDSVKDKIGVHYHQPYKYKFSGPIRIS
jgi:hypothetical protein